MVVCLNSRQLCTGEQLAIAENLCAQTAAALQKLFRARCECAIHPVTRRALLGSIQTNALDLEFPADELVQINSAGDHIAPRVSRRAIVYIQRDAKLFENIERKKCDLALVIVLKIEVTIPTNPAPRGTFDHRHFDHGMRVRLATVMANEIVPRRNVQVTDFHRLQQYLKSS
jgi:hypothetical protein